MTCCDNLSHVCQNIKEKHIRFPEIQTILILMISKQWNGVKGEGKIKIAFFQRILWNTKKYCTAVKQLGSSTIKLAVCQIFRVTNYYNEILQSFYCRTCAIPLIDHLMVTM